MFVVLLMVKPVSSQIDCFDLDKNSVLGFLEVIVPFEDFNFPTEVNKKICDTLSIIKGELYFSKLTDTICYESQECILTNFYSSDILNNSEFCDSLIFIGNINETSIGLGKVAINIQTFEIMNIDRSEKRVIYIIGESQLIRSSH